MPIVEGTQGLSIYYLQYRAESRGKTLIGVGHGSLVTNEEKVINVQIDSIFNFLEPDQIPNPMTKNEYRLLTEDGRLIGSTYHQRIHSICEAEEAFCIAAAQKSRFNK